MTVAREASVLTRSSLSSPSTFCMYHIGTVKSPSPAGPAGEAEAAIATRTEETPG
eukprot:CAMPEP_0182891838 /NCGR_PEP_ID=MMETSP0034_2-20130328/23507_1 /TAXON_ID=156128 /ORGANISM="Nephroselmis pyriformis, Strain CCMP717" /LENGTH=54 /DNA_ID=CAMNT_0025025473 /DNA_START=77 /DNA_END=237 /DNA_ORIENTATION=+